MGFLDRLFGTTTTIFNEAGQIVNTPNEDMLYDSYQKYYVNCSTYSGRAEAYKKCDVVRSVLGKSSSAIANLRVWALDENDNQVKTRQAKRIIDSLKRPNPKEDFKRFFRKLDLNCKLHGLAYVHKKYSNLLDETHYYVIPNKFVTPVYSNQFDENFNQIVWYYTITDGANTYRLNPDEVHIFYDGTLDESGYYTILGGSRLESLSEVISTYVTLWEVLTNMYGDRGALNIISMGVDNAELMSMANLKSEKDNLLKRMSSTYGGRRGQSKNMVVSTRATVSPLTAKMSDMEFSKTIIECKKAISNAFDCPAVLLDIESARFKNSTEAQKNLYTNSAIPTAEYYFSEWCEMIGEIPVGFEIRADYSHLEFYQEAKKSDAIAFQQLSNAVVPLVTNNVISIEEARYKLDL